MLFGIDGRDDVGPTSLRCLKLDAGRERWSEPDFGVASLLAAGDKLLALQTNGRARLIHVDDRGFRPLAGAQLFHGETRALPALSDGRLYARDRSQLACFAVGE